MINIGYYYSLSLKLVEELKEEVKDQASVHINQDDIRQMILFNLFNSERGKGDHKIDIF